MATYIDLMRQAEQLMAEAEKLRQKEVEQVIAEVKEKIKTYGLTADDLGLSLRAERSPAKASSSKPAKKIKYRGPNGETWSGGRGRRPEWVVKLMESGKNIEDFAV